MDSLTHRATGTLPIGCATGRETERQAGAALGNGARDVVADRPWHVVVAPQHRDETVAAVAVDGVVAVEARSLAARVEAAIDRVVLVSAMQRVVTGVAHEHSGLVVAGDGVVTPAAGEILDAVPG